MDLKPESALKRVPYFEKEAHAVSHGLHDLVIKGGKPAREAADLLHGTWMGHPLHSALTDLTIGAWLFGTIFDWIGLTTKSESVERCADRLIDIGNLSAVPTAVAGLTDYSTIPHGAINTGGAHGLINACGFVLNLMSASARRSGRRPLGVTLSAMATGGLLVSAWLGGELSYRYKVGVNCIPEPKGPEDWEPVLDEQDLPESERKRIECQGTPVLLYRWDGEIYATGAVCAHADGPLEEGDFEGTHVTCPWHDSVYDVRDGSVVHGPACYREPVYDVRVREGKIEIRLAQV